ncbi:MAG TPA: CocE/NonD family hydrolase [Actinomycetota bacterium]
MTIRKLGVLALALALAPLAGGSGHAAGTGIQYVTVDDGTEIAVQVFLPSNYVAGETYPTLVQIEGYGGAASPNDGSFVNKPDYVVVGISLRGTGCSAGQLALFSERSSQDGAYVIDNWIPQQDWFNGQVGIYGHSYGGLTGFLVAAQSPAELDAVAVSGLIDDFYRGILYPGGISNYGFPILWGAGVRPLGEHSANAGLVAGDEHCRQNYLDHRGSSLAPTPDIVLDTYGSPFATEESWAIRNALLSHIEGIEVPIQLGQQYQDEQTGPRGGHVLWENLPAGVPKRLTVSTGRHNPNDPTGNKRDWFDCWLIHEGNAAASTSDGTACADVLDPSKRVLLYFESKGADRLTPYVSSDWPLPETDWRRLYLRADHTLSENATGGEGEVSYVSTGNSRHLTLDVGNAAPTGAPLAPYGFTTGLPDTARYELTFSEDAALAGPLELSLWAKLSSPDTDFWAEILDVAPNGDTTFVQRGLLRASYAAQFDAAKSGYAAGELYRPHYRYTEVTPVIPQAPTKFEIEIFPLGHVWRADHTLVLQLHAPPVNDPISTYAYESGEPGLVTIMQDQDHPSTLLLPFMPALPPYRAAAPACGSIAGEVCVTPSLG